MSTNHLPSDHSFPEVETLSVDCRSFPIAASGESNRRRTNHKTRINSSTAPVGCPTPYALRSRVKGLPVELLEQSNHSSVGWDENAESLPDWPSDDSFLDLSPDEDFPGKEKPMVDGADLFEFQNYGLGKKNVLGRNLGSLKGSFHGEEAAEPDVANFRHFTEALQPHPADDSSLEGIGARLKVRNMVAVAVSASLIKIKPGVLSEPVVFTPEEEKKHNMLYKRIKELVDAKPKDIALADWLEPAELELWWQLTGKSVGEVIR